MCAHCDTDQFFGVQFVVRRGQQFSVRMTREQFERVERVLAAKHRVAQQIHELDVQHQQLERLTSAVDAKRALGRVFEMRPGDDPDSYTCMTMCGAAVQVKVQRCCGEQVCEDRRDCLCTPSMCLECMSRWFQEADTTTCPTCRVSFCMEDCVPVDLPKTED
eukprot:TRINITY_DN10602_c0_g1_i5.p2 TRINITY_DN10602_c0_g1~~TRINITY_DN10602_c0_g1_i5.p2  ORF type:complete len:162 (-),score=44.17 TRINITY_DN10602_c0_g1_i5:75-560(-)